MAEEYNKAFAARFAKARAVSGLSQSKLAETMDVTIALVSNWERGANLPTIDKLALLCRTLNVSLYHLIGEEENMGEKRKTLEETYPEGPKLGDTYEFGTEKELRCWYDGKWKPAYRVKTLRTDESANELVDWLTSHGITRITFTPQIQPNGASPAVLFHNKVGSTRFELAMAGDLLVDEQGVFGVRVHGYPRTV